MTIERALSTDEADTGLLDKLTLPDFDAVAPVVSAEPELPTTPAVAVVAAPAPSAPRDRTVLRARQVERVIRRVRLWSVLRVSLVFYVCLWLIATVAGVILWRVAGSGGAIDNVESFMAELLAEDSFVIDGGTILRASALSGLILVVAGTATTVLMALLFNLISELTGGVRVAVVELETAEPVELPSPTRHRRC